MNKKTWIWICAAVVVILAVLLIFKPFGSKAAPEAAEEVAVAEQAAEPAAESVQAAQTAKPEAEKTAEETQEEEESGGTLYVEEDGDIVIVVPEGEGSAGF